jgi:ribose transport system permease protein
MIIGLTAVWDLFVEPNDRIFMVFFKPENLGNILRQNAHYGILAVGMTFVIITAGIDLSVGALLAFSSVVAASMIDRWPGQGTGFALLVFAVGVLAGLALGLTNGFFVTYSKALPGWLWRSGKAGIKKLRIPKFEMLQIQPFIVTLAMMSIARGFAFLWTGGAGVDIYGDQPGLFKALGQDLDLGFIRVPWPGIIFLLVVLMAHITLSRTRFGRFTYAIGSNEPAAILSGIPVARIKVMVYGISGALCGLAAMIYTSVQNAGRPDDGVGFELDAIAATVIGGTSLMGGRGKVGGTLIGALIIGVLNNVLGLRGIDPNLQRVLKGAIIIVAVLLQKERD